MDIINYDLRSQNIKVSVTFKIKSLTLYKNLLSCLLTLRPFLMDYLLLVRLPIILWNNSQLFALINEILYPFNIFQLALGILNYLGRLKENRENPIILIFSVDTNFILNLFCL